VAKCQGQTKPSAFIPRITILNFGPFEKATRKKKKKKRSERSKKNIKRNFVKNATQNVV
jgi:hypothetical protein